MLSHSDKRKFNHSPLNHNCRNSREGTYSVHSVLPQRKSALHSESTESLAVCRTAVALKHNVYDDGGLWKWYIIRPIVLDSISVSLTGITVLHTVGTRRIAVGIGPTNLPLHMHGKLRTSFSLLHKSNIKHKHVYITC